MRFPRELVHARSTSRIAPVGNFVGDTANVGTMRSRAWGGAVLSCVLACGDDDGGSGLFGSGDGADSTAAGDDDDDGGPGSASADTTGSASATADDDDDGPDDGSDDGINLDVGSPEGGFGSCGCTLDYLWVSDYKLGTVSKINTITLVEEARYLTREDGNGNPSRTSVNLAGDVAVANRHGGLVKFWGEVADCQESNGIPGIQTSTGPEDVLPWDEEECRAWYTDFGVTNQRPVAWTRGSNGEEPCDAVGAKVWTVTSENPGIGPGTGGPGGVIAYLVNGDTGVVEEQQLVAGFDGSLYGAYGGAVDGGNNLWFSPLGTFVPGKLVRIDRDSLAPQLWDIPQGVSSYGITVDHTGRVWLASTFGNGAARFDPVTETWDLVPDFWGGSGLAEGPDDLMYISAGNTVRAVHVDTLAVAGNWNEQMDGVKGVSFDGEGYLWAVTYHDEKVATSMAAAYKIDVATMTTVGVYPGIGDPYTYSDMTGNALGSVACMPEG